MKKTKSNPRGAGRPKLGKARLVAMVEPSTMLKIRAVQSASKIPLALGEVVDGRFQ